MIPLALGGLLLRQVPGHLLAGVGSGELRVFGSVVRSVANGKIAGHLQETSGFGKLAMNMLGAQSGAPLQGVGVVADLEGHATTIAQNEQIKAAVSVVQQLQVASLAVSGIGLGVSVAGFAILSAKISRVEARLGELAGEIERVARGVETLRQDNIAQDFTRLRTAAEQMDEGWLLAAPEAQWRRVAHETHAIANTFERRATELVEQRSGISTTEPFLEGLAMAGALRVSARLAAGDDVVARRAAEDGARTLINLGKRFTLSDTVLRDLNKNGVEAGTLTWGEKLDSTTDTFRPAFASLRQREAAAASKALTIAELERQSISGRSWLTNARAEQESPLVCLLPAAA